MYVHNGFEEGDFGDRSLNLLNDLMKSYGKIYFLMTRNIVIRILIFVQLSLEDKKSPADSGGPFVPFFHQHSISEAHKSKRCFEGYLDSHLESFSVKQVPSKNRAGSEENNDRGNNDEVKA